MAPIVRTPVRHGGGIRINPLWVIAALLKGRGK